MEKIIRIIGKEEFTTTNWSGGKTTELFIYPQDSDYKEKNFQFRISSATVELKQSNFTKLTGINRFITPLNANLKLTHDNEKFIELKPFEVYEFSGEIQTISYGKVKDFNLMLRDKARGKLESIKIKDNINLCTANNVLDIFYSYNGEFGFKINGEKYNLKPNQLLILDTRKINNKIDINISSKKENNLLRAIVNV